MKKPVNNYKNSKLEIFLGILMMLTVHPYLTYRLYQINAFTALAALIGWIPTLRIILKSKK